MRRSLGHRSYGCWRKRMSKDENMAGTQSYMDHISDSASFEAFNRKDVDPLLSVESSPESNSMIDFKSFARDYPERLLPLLEKLRPEFQELFAEYWLLGKSQSFIGKVHGFIQTRVWQNLRIIEQSIGSLILLGTSPDAEIIRPILRKAKLEATQYGSLTDMILIYAKTQNYAQVACCFHMPVPAVRKIFRPAIALLLAHKDVKAVAVGAYLRSLTHQASLTGAGLSKRCKARNRRVKMLRFTAPPLDQSPLLSFNLVESLGDIPWCLFEVSSAHRMDQISLLLKSQGRQLFGKKPAQIFAPLDAEGALEFGYLFARGTSTAIVRRLLRIRGIAEMSVLTDDEGNFREAVTVPNAEVQAMIAKHRPPTKLRLRVDDFVQILAGEASGYHGTIARLSSESLQVRVDFPTGRQFLIEADPTSVLRLDVPASKRMFWGPRNA
jgi:hypothetical protein